MPLAALVFTASIAVVASMITAPMTHAEAPRTSADFVRALEGLDDRDDINLVFIVIDTLRADHLSAYGYHRQTSPTLDGLASVGMRFANVRAQSSWTKASMASMWTASYPARTRVLRHDDALPAEAVLPAEILAEEGFRTAGIWRNGWVAPNFGFGQGFDVYLKPSPLRHEVSPSVSAGAMQPTDLDISESAAEFIGAFGDERFFLYLHYMDVHQYLYDQSSSLFGAGYVDAYDNAIHWVDRNVAHVLEALDRRGVLERTLVVVASDHGEAFGEHGEEGHGRNLHAEVTEVPLIVSFPGARAPGVVVNERVQNVDIWPTLLDLLGMPQLGGAHGVSLMSLAGRAAEQTDSARAEAPAPRPSFAHLDGSWGHPGRPSRPLIAVTDANLRLLAYPDRPHELFDLATDPGEQIDRSAERPGDVARLGKMVEEYAAATDAPDWGPPVRVEIDEMQLGQLRAIGYFGGH